VLVHNTLYSILTADEKIQRGGLYNPDRMPPLGGAITNPTMTNRGKR